MRVKLGDYIKEYSVKNKNNEDIPVYSVSNSLGFCKDYFGKEVASKNKTTYKIVPRGCFAYNPSRINVGSVDWQNEEERVIVSPLYNVFSVSPLLDQQYLLYYLKSNVTLSRIRAVASGSVRDNLKLSMLYEFPIDLISLDQQYDVVSTLNAVQKIIDLCQKELSGLDELVRARFVEMFGDPVTNDMLWNTDVLKEICTKIGSGSTPRGGKESYIDEGISLIRSMNVHNAYFEYKDLAHITLDQAEKLNNVVVEHDDLLFNITGASVARCCVVPSDVLPARVNQHVCILRCREKINPIFLQGLLVNENYQGKLLQIAKSGATREAINKQQLESLEIMIPSLELQNQFASFVQEIDKSRLLSNHLLFLIKSISSNH